MTLFNLYEKLEDIANEFINPRTSSVFSARKQLNKFLHVVLHFISESVYKEGSAGRSFSQMLVSFKNDNRISPSICSIGLKFWDNEEQDIDEYFAVAIMFLHEATRLFASLAGDNMSKYISINKTESLTKRLTYDLIKHGADKKMIKHYVDMIDLS